MAMSLREWMDRWFAVKRLDETIDQDVPYPSRQQILHRQKYGYRKPTQRPGYYDLSGPVPVIEDEDDVWTEEGKE